MGYDAAKKAYDASRLLENILAIELLNAAQAIDIPRLGHCGGAAHRIVELLRKRGIWLDAEGEDVLTEENPMLSHLAQASMRGTLAFGNGFTRLLGGKPIRENHKASLGFLGQVAVACLWG